MRIDITDFVGYDSHHNRLTEGKVVIEWQSMLERSQIMERIGPLFSKCGESFSIGYSTKKERVDGKQASSP